MKPYRVDFLVCEDFYEVVTARNAEDAIREATILAEDLMSRRPAVGSRSIDVVKVEEQEGL